MSTEGRLEFLQAAGTHREIGVQLGRFGADIVHRYLTASGAWASVMAFRSNPRVADMRRLVETRCPAYWQELQGMAQGLDLPLEDVFLWNCRGDLWAMAPDGCTTVQIPGDEPVFAHNEDGDPGFRGHCALAHVQPAGGRAFTSFVYPASMPGHTFAVNDAGLAMAVNNIRSRQVGIGLPRMIVGRAILDGGSVDETVGLLRTCERAGAFHVTLAQRGDPRLVSVEFTHSTCSADVLRQPRCHSNHLVHPDISDERQIITASSLSRQQRGDAIIAAVDGTLDDPLSVLWDGANPDLPIYRAQAGDPDHENTLATAVFRIGANSVDWRVYDRRGDPPRFVMENSLTPADRASAR